MSIFGRKSQKINGDIETLTMHVRDLHKRVRPVNDLEQRITEFQQRVHDSRNTMLEQINTQTDRYNQLQDRLRDLTINNHLLRNNVENMKDSHVISILAESKGALLENEVFSFGNGGRESGAGYVMMRRGRILGIGLSSKRQSGEVSVSISVNEKILPGCEITLNTTLRKHDNFSTPVIVEAGSLINFVCKTGNATTENTVASLLIELF
jgi:predicted RNase H-like nuclease (RuvC/YqgF family)